jgi:anti-sigma regulatory factor (Ser/Thr protein kinase)
VTAAGSSPGERFTLELPPDPAYVSAARLFATTIAVQVGVEEEFLDDLKVAIGEACARALATAPERPLSVRAARSALRLAFEVDQGQASTSSPSDLTSTPTPQELAVVLNLELISALFDDADVVLRSDGTPMVRFSVEAGS